MSEEKTFELLRDMGYRVEDLLGDAVYLSEHHGPNKLIQTISCSLGLLLEDIEELKEKFAPQAEQARKPLFERLKNGLEQSVEQELK